jgi:hypothetical protein
MKRIVLALAFVALLAMPHLSSANITWPSSWSLFNCDTLFTTGAISPPTGGSAPPVKLVNPALVNYGTYKTLLELAFFIVLMVLTVLGLCYAIGLSFGIQRLVTFVKTEYLESAMNLIIIAGVMVTVVNVGAGGTTIFDGITNFLVNLALGVNNLPAAAPTTSQGAFVQTCTSMMTGIVDSSLQNYATVFFNLFINYPLINFAISIKPNDFGFSVQPWNGVQTLNSTVWIEEGIAFTILMMSIALIMFLFVIYWLFPVFFFVGLFLRSFPWTRAAGGALLALFISFYIVFPSLVYPFALITSPGGAACSGSNVCAYYLLCSPSALNEFTYQGADEEASLHALCDSSSFFGRFSGGAISALEGLFNSAASPFGLGSFGQTLYDNLAEYSAEVAYSMVLLMGVIIAFIISYDLLEALGDLLGAPSLQSNRILSKVI